MSHAALQARSDQNSLSEGDVRAALRKQNPTASLGDVRTLARVMAAVWEVVAELPEAERREIAQGKDKLRVALLDAWRSRSVRPDHKSVEDPGGDVEFSRGTGLGERIRVAEGRKRLDRYAKARPLESWAGPTAGTGEIEETLGIPRSTLSSWQQNGSVIGLLRGERKRAYPLEQFVDARPLEGVADILKVTPDARSAWLWLRQPHGSLQHRLPLDVLKEGGREAVVRAAERDFV
ncbi:antitoxin Xre/MbcA/ParS toxin-binding domain-containing protein [Lichenihabitans psoromatis]|uniref:antitoxin Xre/MbcA/ParS-like domain-containing protein n=1 Tax=Lichenihabitans psoromatis TaxID=2528642 RepID=UPI001FE03134|nr:antitoxin Xre/MbcA/ParS toxin-binding domain-containing protein [Lichenihabitans psoromatis]